jgi:hypothetical protein
MTTPTKQDATPLDALLSRRAAIDARIKAVENKLAAKSRKDDTRLKILVGAAFLADAVKHPELKPVIRTTLDRAITNAKDRDFLRSKGLVGKDHDAQTHHAEKTKQQGHA